MNLNRVVPFPLALALILILTTAVIIVDYWQYSEIKKLKVAVAEISIPKKEVIDSFEECINAGYPASGTSPRECETPNGKVFIESID